MELNPRPFLALALLCILGSVASPSAAADGLTLEVKEAAPQANRSSRQITGTWNGKYWHREESARPPVEFRAVLTVDGSALGGRIVEPETRGDETVGVIHASIVDGIAAEDGSVRFTERYDDAGKSGRSVEYEGIYSPDGAKISGTWTRFRSYFWGHWKRKIETGPFEMHRQR